MIDVLTGLILLLIIIMIISLSMGLNEYKTPDKHEENSKESRLLKLLKKVRNK